MQPDADALVSFEPVALGPFEVSRVPASGVLLALFFLLSLRSCLGLAGARDVSKRVVVEAHLAGVLAAFLGSRLPAFLRAWPAPVDDASSLWQVLSAPPSTAGAALSALAVLPLARWVAARPLVDVADVLAPALALAPCAGIAGSLVAAPRTSGFASGVLAAAALGTAGALLATTSRCRDVRGAPLSTACAFATAALLALVVSSEPAGDARLLLAGGLATALALLLVLHLWLRCRASRTGAADRSPNPR